MEKQETAYQLEGKTLYEHQKKIRLNKNYFFAPSIVAYNLYTPWNYGSILRIADAAGSKELLFVVEQKIQNFNKIKKTARNCDSFVNWKTETVEQFHNKSIDSFTNLIAIEITSNSDSLYNINLPKYCTFVIGNERSGIPSEVLKKCNKTIHIPMHGVNGSMNVSHALAVVLFEWRRQYSDIL